MNEDFVTYTQAVKLKELRFDWKCNYYYEHDKSFHIGFYQNFNHDRLEMVNGEIIRTTSVSAPTLSQVHKWLREVNDIHIEIKYTPNPQYEPWIGKVITLNNGEYIETDTCDTYKEALLEGIDKSLELLKDQNNRNQN